MQIQKYFTFVIIVNRAGKLPPRCVLNGLKTESIPVELTKLDSLSCQLIQKAKCYQTIVRLGTYTAKVPKYNSLKACSGAMFFLPLPRGQQRPDFCTSMEIFSGYFRIPVIIFVLLYFSWYY